MPKIEKCLNCLKLRNSVDFIVIHPGLGIDRSYY